MLSVPADFTGMRYQSWSVEVEMAAVTALPLPMGPLGLLEPSLGSVSAEMEPGGGGGGGGPPPKSEPSTRLPGDADSALSVVCSTHEPLELPSGLRFMDTPSVDESDDG